MLTAIKKLKKKKGIIAAVTGLFCFALLSMMLFGSGLWMSSCEVKHTSMFPTLRDGQIVCISTIVRPANGRIAVIDMSSYTGREENYIKRVIGSGGDRVVMRRDGDAVRITVNGEEEHYAAETMRVDRMPWDRETKDWSTAFKETGSVTIDVPEGELFVLGDNRNNSTDSRSFGTVLASDVVGIAVDIGWGGEHTETLLAIARLVGILGILALFFFGENAYYTGEEPYDY